MCSSYKSKVQFYVTLSNYHWIPASSRLHCASKGVKLKKQQFLTVFPLHVLLCSEHFSQYLRSSGIVKLWNLLSVFSLGNAQTFP